MTVRNLSSGAIRDLFVQNSGAVMLSCVTFNHFELPEPIRVVNNTVAIQFDGHEWIALPFELTLPSDNEDRVPNLEMIIDNIDRTLVELLRSVSSMPSVRVDIIRVDGATITREIGPLDFSLLSSDIGVDAVTLTIGYAFDILNEPATQDILNPGTAPGLFN